MTSLVLFLNWYNPDDPARARELRRCLLKNLENPRVGLIVSVNTPEEEPPYDTAKLVQLIIPPKRRPRFCDLFAFASDEYAGHLCAIANADVIFDDSLDALDMEGRVWALGDRVLALSRWEPSGSGPEIRPGAEYSQDAWIFRAPLRLPFGAGEYLQGTPGCDNRLAHELAAAGRPAFNPCRSIRLHHVHAGGRPSNIAPVAPPYLAVPPGTLADMERAP